MSLPNNWNMAENRLMHLKRWFQKDFKFYEDDNKFVEEIISKGYAREAKTNAPDGRRWYLPHHDVYHPHKASKPRVVFECSTELNGRPINKELFPGPDLANKKVEVLTKFRENQVAFMADIEQMYFLIFAAEQHRSLLRFLWRKEGNISDKPIDYQMCNHVFEGVSSGACSNYALKMTVIESKEKFGEEAGQTLQNNFYVDELLMSVANEDITVQLIKVTGMCHEEGFNLTKFTSNIKRVLESIPKKDRQSGVKDKDIVKDLTEEQVPDVLWNIEDDAFGVKAALKSKLMTRRGVLSVLSSVYDPLGFGALVLLKGKQILQKLCQQGLK